MTRLGEFDIDVIQMGEDEILAHLEGLVKNIAKRYSRPNEYEDLVQVGRLAVINAIRTYDPKRNTKFITHAYRCITRFARHYLRDTADMIRVPAYQQEANRCKTHPVRLIRTEMPSDLVDRNLDHSITKLWLWDALKKLPDQDRQILLMHRIEEYTAREISQMLGMPELLVRNTLVRSTRQLRKSL